MIETIHQLKSLADDYVPSAEVAEKLSEVVLAPVIGPAAIGKNACISAVAELDPEFGVSQSFTTRPQEVRDSEDEYRYLPHTAEDLATLLERVRRGDLVQYAVHPTTEFVYGSELRDYAYPYMMLDCLATSVPPLRRLPYRRSVEISLVTDPRTWVRRFEATRSADLADMVKRLMEARRSLEWSLDQGDSMVWVNNVPGQLDVTAREIHGVIRGDRQPDMANRTVGERLWQIICLMTDS